MGVASYFNLNSGAGARSTRLSARTADGMPAWEQITMYLGVLVGVIASTAVQQFTAGGDVAFSASWGMLAIAALVALVLIPMVFEKLRVDPHAPFIVRLGLFVQTGVFWQVVMAGIAKAM